MEDRLRSIIESCFPPDRLDGIHIFSAVVETLAFAYVKGNTLAPFNHAPLRAINGTVVLSSETRLTIRGQLDGSVIEVRLVCTCEVGRNPVRRKKALLRDPRALSYSALA